MLRLAAIALCLANPAVAKDIDTLAEDYVNLPANQQMITEMFSPEDMAAQFATGLPPGVSLTDTQRTGIGSVLSGVLTDMRPELEAAMVEASADRFTQAELEALIGFYSSDVGASVLLKMQPYFQDYMADIQPGMMDRIRSALPEITPHHGRRMRPE